MGTAQPKEFSSYPRIHCSGLWSPWAFPDFHLHLPPPRLAPPHLLACSSPAGMGAQPMRHWSPGCVTAPIYS